MGDEKKSINSEMGHFKTGAPLFLTQDILLLILSYSDLSKILNAGLLVVAEYFHNIILLLLI